MTHVKCKRRAGQNKSINSSLSRIMMMCVHACFRVSLFFYLPVLINLKIFIYNFTFVFRLVMPKDADCLLNRSDLSVTFMPRVSVHATNTHCVLNYSCSHCLLSLCDHLNSLALATISFLVEIVEFKAFHNAHTIRTHKQQQQQQQ